MMDRITAENIVVNARDKSSLRFDVETAEMQRLVSLVQKREYSVSDLKWYFFVLDHWLSESTTASRLLSMRDVFAALNPAPPIPDFLWRGLAELERVPERGQKVVYGTRLRYAHFSEKQSVAEDFSGINDSYKGPGIVLKVSKKEIDEQIIFLWPIQDSRPFFAMGVNDTYMHEKEWGIYIRVPMKVAGWYTGNTEKLK